MAMESTESSEGPESEIFREDKRMEESQTPRDDSSDKATAECTTLAAAMNVDSPSEPPPPESKDSSHPATTDVSAEKAPQPSFKESEICSAVPAKELDGEMSVSVLPPAQRRITAPRMYTPPVSIAVPETTNVQAVPSSHTKVVKRKAVDLGAFYGFHNYVRPPKREQLMTNGEVTDSKPPTPTNKSRTKAVPPTSIKSELSALMREIHNTVFEEHKEHPTPAWNYRRITDTCYTDDRKSVPTCVELLQAHEIDARSIPEMSVEQVASMITKLFGGNQHNLKQTFEQEQIDGAGLLLLNLDGFVRLLKVPIGPAITIDGIVKRARELRSIPFTD